MVTLYLQINLKADKEYTIIIKSLSELDGKEIRDHKVNFTTKTWLYATIQRSSKPQ